MGKRYISWVIVLLYAVIFTGVWCIPLHVTLAQDDVLKYTIKFDANLEGTTPSTYVFVQFRECTQDIDGNVTLLEVNPINAIANTNKALNFDPFKDKEVVVELPKNTKFIIEITPIADKTNPTIYSKQYYCKARDLDDIDHLYVLSTSSPAPLNRFELEEGKKIGGKIKNSSGNNIGDIKVKLIDKNNQPVPRYAVSSGTQYVIKGLTPGEYYIWADGAPEGYSRKFYSSTGSTENFEEAELVVVPDSSVSVSNKDITLSDGKSVLGKILAPNGTAFQHYTEIYLLDATYGLPIGMYIHDPNYPQMTEEQALVRELIQYGVSGGTMDLAYCGFNSDGSYEIGGISTSAVSDAILYARDPYGNYSAVYYDNVHFLGKATKIPLDTIQDRQFNLQFEEAGLISGTVKDLNGTCLQDITVKAIDASNEQNVFQVYTDSNGSYEIRGLPLGQYKLQVQDGKNNKYLWQYYENELTFIQAKVLELKVGNRIKEGYNFNLKIGGRIAGKIVNESGIALDNIPVFALRLGSGSALVNYPVATSASGADMSGSDGSYEIGGLPAGNYVIFAKPLYGDNYCGVFYKNSDILNYADANIFIGEDPNQLVSGCDFKLNKGSRIEGDITGIPSDLEKSLKSYASIDLYDVKTDYPLSLANWDIDPNTWHYVIMGIPAGEYKICISDTKPLTDAQASGKMLKKFYKESDPQGVFTYTDASAFTLDPIKDPNKDINFIWDTIGSTIKGEVFDDANNVQLSVIRIDAYQIIKEAYGNKEKLGSTGFYTYTNDDGKYSLTGLGKGEYILKASDETDRELENGTKYRYATEFYDESFQCYEFDPNENRRVNIDLFNTTFSSKDFRLNKIGNIRGKVTKGQSAISFADAWVYLYSVKKGNVLMRYTLANTDGNYFFGGLPDGKYKVRAFDPNQSLVPRYYTNNSTTYAFNIEDGTELVINYNEPTASLENINICLNREGTQIHGTVSKDGANNSPLQNVLVYLYQKRGTSWVLVGDLSISDYTRFTDAAGDYSISGLPFGLDPSGNEYSYKVLAWDYNEGHYSEYYSVSNVPEGDSFTLTSSGKTVNFSLTPIAPQDQKDFILELSKGMNLFCLPTGVPLWPAQYYASTLNTEWTATNGPGIKLLLGYDNELRRWENQYTGLQLLDGEGYIVYLNLDKKIKYHGLPLSDTVNLKEGMNIVGNIYGGSNYTSYRLWNDLPPQTLDIRRFEAKKGKWLSSTLLWGKSVGTDFDILPGEGYIIDTAAPGAWIPPL